jgi:hypothetical protein
MEAQDASAQLAPDQDAEAHDAEAQEALDQDAEAQDALAQEADAHEASAAAVLAQLAASKAGSELPAGSGTTKRFKARFGFGALVEATALATSTIPTPTESGAAPPAGRAVTMSAPLT